MQIPEGNLHQLFGLDFEDYKQRKTTYNEILASGDHEKIIRIIKIINIHKLKLEQEGKQLINTDKELLKAAERLIHHEFAAVLDLEPDQITDYIIQNIGVFNTGSPQSGPLS